MNWGMTLKKTGIVGSKNLSYYDPIGNTQQRRWQLVALINEYEGHIYLCHIILTNLRTSLQLRIDCSHQLRAVDRPYREDSEGHSPLGAGDLIVT